MLNPSITGRTKSVNPLAAAPLAPIGPFIVSATLSVYPAIADLTLMALTSPPDTRTANLVEPNLVLLTATLVLLLYPLPEVSTTTSVIVRLSTDC